MLLLLCCAFLGDCVKSTSITCILSVILPLLGSASLAFLCSCIFMKWSIILLNLSAVYGGLLFDISLLRYSSGVIQ